MLHFVSIFPSISITGWNVGFLSLYVWMKFNTSSTTFPCKTITDYSLHGGDSFHCRDQWIYLFEQTFCHWNRGCSSAVIPWRTSCLWPNPDPILFFTIHLKDIQVNISHSMSWLLGSASWMTVGQGMRTCTKGQASKVRQEIDMVLSSYIGKFLSHAL